MGLQSRRKTFNRGICIETCLTLLNGLVVNMYDQSTCSVRAYGICKACEPSHGVGSWHLITTQGWLTLAASEPPPYWYMQGLRAES
jgi:hypothetical protein